MGVSATTTTLVQPPEGHSSLFFTSRSSPNSLSPPSGLPVESFLNVMEFLDETDLVRCSHVCVNWRKAILGCSKLWTELSEVKIASMNSLDRVRAVASRSNGKLRLLDLDFDSDGELDISMLPVVPLLRQIFHEISKLDGARSLLKLVLDLTPYRHIDDLEPAYKVIALAVQFAEFSAVSLREFRLSSVLPQFPSGGILWFAMPSLEKLFVSCRGAPSGMQLPDIFSTSNAVSSTQTSTSTLKSIHFVGTNLNDVTYPTFNRLTSLRLYEMPVLNLYGLLSKCASTLKTLHLRQSTSDSPYKYLSSSSGNKDAPPVLSLPVLEELEICGQNTPLLWVVPTETSSSFMTDTPALEAVDFGPHKYFHHGIDDEYDDDETISACKGLDSTVMIAMFRHSPLLKAINLKRTNVTPEMLVASLPDAPTSLVHLSIGGTTACNDSFVDRLAHLIPQLEELDVYDNEWTGLGERTVSVQCLARFAKAMQEKSSARAVLGKTSKWYLEITADGDYRTNNEEESATIKRDALKNLLGTLSSSQFSHLGSSLQLNTPPPLPSISLSFSSIKAELSSLITTPPSPPYAAPFPPKENEPAYNKSKGRKKKKNSPIAAPRDIVESAERQLKAWIKQREEEAAEEWIEEQGDIEIRWGTMGCGDEGCGCEVGGELWKDSDDSEDEEE